MRRRIVLPPKVGDRELFFSMIPWSIYNEKGILLRIENADNKLMGFFLFDEYTPGIIDGKSTRKGGNIFVSGVSISRHWFCSRDIFRCLFSYPFTQLECARLTTLTPIFNKRAIKLNIFAGLKQEGILRKCYTNNNEDYDAIIMGITKEEVQQRGFI